MLLTSLFLTTQIAAAQVDAAVQGGIDGGSFPGAVVVIGTMRGVLYTNGIGHFTWDADSPVPDPDSTLFDLASLTKVVATTPSIMRLVEQGELDLDSPVVRHLPGFAGGNKDAVTIRHLLEHRSGLRAFLPLNTETETAEEAKARVLSEPLRWDPGGRVAYSDLNAMLLGWIVEAVGREPLDVLAAATVFDRLGMTSTQFRPPRSARSRMVPVGLWRGHAIAGELHDQNAVRLGGVSGHAGLYSTGADMAVYARMWLGKGTVDGTTVFRPGMVDHFRRRGPGNRALGWQMRDTTESDNTGTKMSSATFGHTGYTGTSIWIDPIQDLFVILLTNRVFSPRGPSITTLKRVRGEVADAAVALRREVCGANPSC
ncbi:MAG: serine hydrolase domain-containing protein [Gemmatimonadales bacterium]